MSSGSEPVLTQRDQVAHGRELVRNGDLLDLKDKLGVSLTTLAHMIEVTPTQMLLWVKGAATPSAASATSISTWYDRALAQLAVVGVISPDLVHVSTASQQLGASYATLTDWCERGLLRCLDLGVLGRYVNRDDVEAHLT